MHTQFSVPYLFIYRTGLQKSTKDSIFHYILCIGLISLFRLLTIFLHFFCIKLFLGKFILQETP